jgi:hypothetical protein
VHALRESVTLQVVENHYPLVVPANDSLYLLEDLVLWAIPLPTGQTHCQLRCVAKEPSGEAVGKLAIGIVFIYKF